MQNGVRRNTRNTVLLQLFLLCTVSSYVLVISCCTLRTNIVTSNDCQLFFLLSPYLSLFLFARYHRMIDSCSAKCVAANGYHEEDLNKGETVCINRCVKKFLEVHKFVQEKMQENQAQQGAAGNQ